MPNAKPVMIHSLFRAGSTYIFNVFRRSDAGFWCYQEPLHEGFADHSPNAQWRSQTTGESQTEANRHPSLDHPYFWEFTHCADFVESHYREEFAFKSYFLNPDDEGPSGLRSYIKGLDEYSTGRTVFQFCRSTGRMSWLQKQFDALHIYLWRNPWDQWWSYKINHYFDNSLVEIYSATNLPGALAGLRDRETSEFFKLFGYEAEEHEACDIPLIMNPERSYFLFYGLWAWSLLSSRFVAHEHINIDSLNSSLEYRKDLTARLANLGINGLNFDDVNVSQMAFDDADKKFFTDIENVVHQQMLASGVQKSDLEWLMQQRKFHTPGQRILSNIGDAGALRSLYRRIGNLTKTFYHTLYCKLKVQIAAQEHSDLKEQLIKSGAALIESQHKFDCIENKAQIAEQKCAELKELLAEVRARERDLLESTSWKITAPFRRLRGLLAHPRKAQTFHNIPKSPEIAKCSASLDASVNQTPNRAATHSAFNFKAEDRRNLFLSWLEDNIFSQYDLDHKVRFWETYLRLDEYLEIDKKALELGGESKIANYLKNQLGMTVDTYGQDLRYPFECEAHSFDIILCLEVIEHIKDRTETSGISEIAMFNRSGLRNVFAESNRILNAGGILFMSTPNACSIDSIARIFLYQSPQLYAPHVKEFAAAELVELANENGFELLSYTTANVWNPLPTYKRENIENILKNAGIPTEDRGDDMFLIFKKFKAAQ